MVQTVAFTSGSGSYSRPAAGADRPRRTAVGKALRVGVGAPEREGRRRSRTPMSQNWERQQRETTLHPESGVASAGRGR
jgi:hypothetical protein